MKKSLLTLIFAVFCTSGLFGQRDLPFTYEDLVRVYGPALYTQEGTASNLAAMIWTPERAGVFYYYEYELKDGTIVPGSLLNIYGKPPKMLLHTEKGKMEIPLTDLAKKEIPFLIERWNEYITALEIREELASQNQMRKAIALRESLKRKPSSPSGPTPPTPPTPPGVRREREDDLMDRMADIEDGLRQQRMDQIRNDSQRAQDAWDRRIEKATRQ